MKKRIRFYYCTICGNIVEKVYASGNIISCCGKSMVELEAGTSDGKVEFHVPAFHISHIRFSPHLK